MRVKIGFRIPSVPKRMAAFKSGLPGGKRYWRHHMGLKMPKNTAWIFNPKKFIYNKVYHRTTRAFVPGGLFFNKPRNSRSILPKAPLLAANTPRAVKSDLIQPNAAVVPTKAFILLIVAVLVVLIIVAQFAR